MIILVDYDNIPTLERGRGIVYVVERVARVLAPALIDSANRLRVRLYGGWFEQGRLTRAGQTLSAQVQSASPHVITLLHEHLSTKVLATIELAHALECAPTKLLTHTYRPRGLPGNIKCNTPPFPACTNRAHCQLLDTYNFFMSKKCPSHMCEVIPENVFYRGEQKLVDTMMVADLIHFSRMPHEALAIVTNDDDVLPGIQAALIYGSTVHHIHPITGRATPTHYRTLLDARYFEYSF